MTATTRPLAADRRSHELPALAPVDRLALHLGLQLMLWSRRHAERTARAADAPRDERAARAAQHAFEQRTWAGPSW